MTEASNLKRRSLLVGTAALSIAAPFNRASAAEPVVDTTAGKLRGKVDKGVSVFRGIPYAASTAGANRFKPPQKVAPWPGLRDAFTNGFTAPQNPGDPGGPLLLDTMLNGNPTMSEDCLFVNVYTPGVNDNRKRPVMVWLHGGGWTYGAGTAVAYDGTNLARRGDVVVVGVNHRLNGFGFLYLADLLGPDYADSGNAGILDIVAALQWVHENIAKFGGDPGNVTIFGQSGGGAKVSCLTAMPAAKGLFHKAIVQSGGSVLRQRTPAAAAQGAADLVKKLGLGRDKAGDLRTLPMQKLIEAFTGDPALAKFSPVVDGRALTRDPYAPDAPPISAEVPMMIGSTATEGTYRYKPDDPIFKLDDAELRRRLMLSFTEGLAIFPGDDPVQKDQRQRIKPIIGDKIDGIIAMYKAARPAATPTDLFWIIATDVGTVSGGHVQAERKAAAGKAPVYVYEMAWRTKVLNGVYRSPHTLEIPFVFDNTDKVPTEVGTDAAALKPVTDMLSDSWIAFARSGNPNGAGRPTWPVYDAKTRPVMVIDSVSAVSSDKRRAELDTLRALGLPT